MTARHIQRLTTSGVIPPAVFVALAVVLAVVFLWVAPDVVIPEGGAELGTLNDSKKEALTITLEMNKFVISLATLIFGAVAALVVGKEDVRRLNQPQVALALTTLLATCSALYFSYFTYDRLVVMLSNGFLEFGDDSLVGPRRLQINSLAVAVVMLAALFLAMVRQAMPDDPSVQPRKGSPHDKSGLDSALSNTHAIRSDESDRLGATAAE